MPSERCSLDTVYMATHSGHQQHPNTKITYIGSLLSALLIFPDKPAGFVNLLFVEAVISSNKNVMHSEKKVERISEDVLVSVSF